MGFAAYAVICRSRGDLGPRPVSRAEPSAGVVVFCGGRVEVPTVFAQYLQRIATRFAPTRAHERIFGGMGKARGVVAKHKFHSGRRIASQPRQARLGESERRDFARSGAKSPCLRLHVVGRACAGKSGVDSGRYGAEGARLLGLRETSPLAVGSGGLAGGSKALIKTQAQTEAEVSAARQALILKANHPSPLSALRTPAPFIGCGHFSAAQDWLAARGLDLDWSL